MSNLCNYLFNWGKFKPIPQIPKSKAINPKKKKKNLNTLGGRLK